MLNIKYKRKWMRWKQKVNIEMIQNIAKSKQTNKSKRQKDEEYTKNKKGRKQPHPKTNASHWKNKQNLNISG